MAKILVVDDQEKISRLCETVLVHHGHAVTVASDRKAFLDAIQKENYDILLVDLRMPDMDGIECSQIARHHQSTIGIILMTGSFDWDEKEKEWIRSVPSRIVFKPFGTKDLEEAVESYLKRFNLGD